MSDFIKFKNAVAKKIEQMGKSQMFVVGIDKDEMWNIYLDSFPEGTNNIYKERREYDCNCCRQFVKNIGAAVTINENGTLETIWDIKVPGYYQAVVDAMAETIKSHAVVAPYMHFERHVGTQRSNQLLENGQVKQWEHFHANVPAACYHLKDTIAIKIGDYRGTFDVLKRSMEELTLESAEVVLELIAQNSLYRGEEHKNTVKKFVEVKRAYDKADHKDNLLWQKVMKEGHAMRFRNTVIGTLLIDLSEGKDLEDAVKAFESKVAPSNYKRSSALVTQGMIDSARKKVAELGLEDSLYRRYAVVTDLTINNVLFADRTTKKAMNVFDELLTPTKKKEISKIEEVSVEKFLSDILPSAKTVEVMFDNKHVSNLVSLLAPTYDDSALLFKWDNNFSWSYNGDVTDSELRRAVQARGGRVDGAFRFSHSWNYGKRNASLMDLHVFMPGSNIGVETKNSDYYGTGRRIGWNLRGDQLSGGRQDVDYTDAAPVGYVPVENITFPDLKKMPEGRYICKIHNWALREPTQGGFRAEIEFGGQVFQYEYDKPLKNKEWVTVAEVHLKNGEFTIKHHLPEASQAKTEWNIETTNFHKVSMILNSPNHWDGNEIGNKHLFFMIEGCKNPNPARGFYNEYLKNELTPHRKVFEILASKMKAEYNNDQLSGLGFSSTKHEEVVVKVTGKFERVLKIKF